MCHLAQYVLQTLPEDVAVVVFVCEKLVPDVVQWSRSCPINWKRLLRCWITELFVMNRQVRIVLPVHRRASTGCGAFCSSRATERCSRCSSPFCPATSSSSSERSPRRSVRSECAGSLIASYLETEFLKQVVNIGDIVLNFRVLIAPNQSTSRFFELSYIRGLRLQCLWVRRWSLR